MKQIDRFLIMIVAGILALAAVALALALIRGAPDYMEDATPGAVAYNYLLALTRRDDPRAYGYLSPDLEGYPADVDAFTADVDRYVWRADRNSASFSIADERIDNDRAVVTIDETRFSRGGLFGSSQYRNSFTLTLRRQAEGWKLVSAQSYWAPCWNTQEACDRSFP